MGNVPYSCCRSNSPNDSSNSQSSESAGKYSANKSNGCKLTGRNTNTGSANKGKNLNTTQSNVLQHISEREPDDSDNDPSSNPLNKPIFAARSIPKPTRQTRDCCSCGLEKGSSSDNNTGNSPDINTSSSYECSTPIQQSNHPLLISQDQGYNSTTDSTNPTQFDGNLDESFNKNQTNSSLLKERIQESNISDQHNQLICTPDVEESKTDLDFNRLSLQSSRNRSHDHGHIDYNSADTGINSSSVDNNLLSTQHNSVFMRTSSCSRLYTDGSTISQPNFKQTLRCVSLAVYYHIKNRTSDDSIEIFDETVHPLKMPKPDRDDKKPNDVLTKFMRKLQLDEFEDNSSDNDDLLDTIVDPLQEPSQKAIHQFVKTLFSSAQLTSEYAITTLVYLERLMTYAEMDLTPKTWRRMFLGAIVLSSKVWEDQAVWNVDYAQILEEISVEDINELERHFLELIQFNMNVPSSVYAKYYFHLRSLAMANGLSKGHSRLTIAEAKKLEAMTGSHLTDWNSSPIHRKMNHRMKRYTSLEGLRLKGRSQAVLM